MLNPKISVIIPNLNNGKYVEDCILSVLYQNYTFFEVIVIDGQSTDNSVELIKKYESKICYWISEPDNGQSNAINKGLRKATGDIICYLNSDDYFLPGAFNKIVNAINSEDEIIIFGNCIHLNEAKIVASGSNIRRNSEELDIFYGDYIIQPSTFWTKKVIDKIGLFREDLSFCFDWEWFMRCKKQNIKFQPIDDYLSVYRFHPLHKTSSGGVIRANEIKSVLKEIHSKEIYANILFYIEKSKKIENLIQLLIKLRLYRFKETVINMIFNNILLKLNKNQRKSLKYLLAL